MSELIKIEQLEPGIMRLVLNDPENRNAMSEKMAAEFAAAINKLENDSAIRVLVLTGAGKAFSGGGHLDMLFEKTKIAPEKNRELMQTFYQQFLSVRRLPIPVIAAINGHAMGAAFCLALACDIRVSVSDAKMGLNFVHLGLHPGMGATYFLPRLVGPAVCAELLYRGLILSAADAKELGLLNHVVDSRAFNEAVLSVARDIAAVGPQAIRELKETLRSSESYSLEDCLNREAACQALDYSGPQFLEGITAAREKRSPKFS